MPYQTSRRSGRLSKTIPILLIGASTEGRVFSEKTQTVVISLHGAGILSRNTFVAEQELILRSLETNREAAIRVLGEIGSQSGLYSYGVAFVDEQLDFWKVNFPPPPTSKAPREPLYLECSTCKAPVLLEHGDFEFDVCAIHGGLVRYCEQCSIATVWRVALQPAMPDLGILFPERKSVTAAASPASARWLQEIIPKPNCLHWIFRANPFPNRKSTAAFIAEPGSTIAPASVPASLGMTSWPASTCRAAG